METHSETAHGRIDELVEVVKGTCASAISCCDTVAPLRRVTRMYELDR
jgi:hypothetical protein